MHQQFIEENSNGGYCLSNSPKINIWVLFFHFILSFLEAIKSFQAMSNLSKNYNKLNKIFCFGAWLSWMNFFISVVLGLIQVVLIYFYLADSIYMDISNDFCKLWGISKYWNE